MAQQAELFPKPEETIFINKTRSEPALWVRRFVLWAQPGEVIRDIPLRRGLNVVWSPDPGPSAANVGQNSDSGHGAGKTLFCRLLRYCLGEATFASEDQRRIIGSKFPNGLVGVEAVVAGTVWSVIRPIGQTRRHLVRQNVSLEDLLASKEAATGIEPLLEVLSGVVSPSSMSGVVPELRDESSWLFALAWLARDQENRFDHILDWRHARSESGSSVSSLSKERVLAGVRALLGLLDDEEIRLKNDRQRIPVKRLSIERDLTYLKRRTDELRDELFRRSGTNGDGGLGGRLDLAALQAIGHERRQIAEEAASLRPFAPQIAALGRQRDGVLQESAVLAEQAKGLDAHLNTANQHMRALQGERTDLKAEEFRSTHGDMCPICFVPIDLALAQGCSLSSIRRAPESVEDEKTNLAARMEDCRSAIKHYSEETAAARTRLSSLRAQEESLKTRAEELEGLAEQQREKSRRQRSEAESFQEDIAEFAEAQDRLLKAQASVLVLDDREKELLELQTALRDRHGEVLRRVNELFVFVSRSLLGSDVEASIDLTDQRLQASVQVGGQAMESLKTLAFDFMSILMSLEGRAGIPAFLIHDSPREADLGESIYHRLFRFAVSLESLSEQPPFQYIVTTTSNPPAEIQSSERLVQHLSGSAVEDRLFRCELG